MKINVIGQEEMNSFYPDLPGQKMNRKGHGFAPCLNKSLFPRAGGTAGPVFQRTHKLP